MSQNDFTSALDRPEIINFLFYPRKEDGRDLPEYAKNFDVQARDGIRIGCRIYFSTPERPHILFFHGNGEIAEDYDDIGQIYTKLNMNFIVADYRGYGRSEGQPGVTAMLNDAHDTLKSVHDRLNRENRSGPLWLMGRSLGSAPAIELAVSYPEMVKGLIIESGFAETISLLKRLGINTERLNIADNQVFSNADKIKIFAKPTLVIHAQNDQIIPLHHGEALFHHSPSKIKKLHVVQNADHNTIMMVAGISYFILIQEFINQIGESETART